MLWSHRSNKAQIFAEHTVLYFMIIGIIVSMTIYMARSLQTRIFEARKYMMNAILTTKTATNAVGKLRLEYEPYYANSETLTDRQDNEQKQLLGGGRTGIFRQSYDSSTTSLGNSTQLPPVNAD